MDRLLLMNSPIRRSAAAAGPATEDIRPATDTISPIVVGAATAHAALSDNSDSSYTNVTDPYSAGFAWAGAVTPLAQAAGRPVVGAILVIRAAAPSGSNQLRIGGGGGTTTPNPNTSITVNSPAITTYTSSLLTKAGGGTWSEAAFNALSFYVASDGYGDPWKCYEVTVRAVY